MSELTDAMAAAITQLKNQNGAITPDQVKAEIHNILDPQVADLNSKISTITAGESDDSAKIADIQAAIGEFTTAFAPAAAAAASASAPASTPAPTSAPTSVPAA